MSEKRIKGVGDYDKAAGGWGALRSVAGVLADQETVAKGGATLLRANQPDGFDCPGCAWPDPKHTSSFEFCENGAKAVAWEATTKRAGPELFAAHTVSELWGWSDHALEDAGRLTHPLAYDPATDRYVETTWDETFARIGATLRTFDHPDRCEFYASGRASNEAAFLWQLFGRAFGTNNFPDCSNMCHEATSVALPEQLGVGKASVSLEDFDHADLILSFGHNPGTNHPRMMTTLRAAAKRGCRILVFNPIRERALERFTMPQSPVEMTTGGSTPIASHYYQVKVGGDAALVRGLIKAVLELEVVRGGVLDADFIAAHTDGLEAVALDVAALGWDEIERDSGLTRAQIEEAAALYADAKATILCYGMGITQHRSSSSLIQQLANLILLRGNIGRPGAGICPVRGHSNVQGARTVGVAEKPPASLLDAMEAVFNLPMPRGHGHNVVEAIEAMRRGETRAILCLGGNLAVAAPDHEAVYPAFRSLDLTVHVATKLNRTHLLCGKASFILPCLGRTETDVQASGEQAVTVEDSMSMVHASRGRNAPASEHLRSEPAIIAGLAKAALANSAIEWDELTADYDRIRDLIEAVFPDAFGDYNARIREPGGFRLPLAHAERVWKTATGKARFLPFRLDDGPAPASQPGVFTLTTIRSHDQYNTTIYGMNDRYRGVFSRRDVVFLSAGDIAALGLEPGAQVDVVAASDPARRLNGVFLVAKDLPSGSAAAYYPEANPLCGLEERDERSGTPAYKSIPVRIMAANR
ncbi:MAG: FdhF/YdeP family oxidoreductase [Caulobacteraceae bacterium]